MPSRDITLASRIGLHGRPAALVVQTAAAHPATVWLSKNSGPRINAASILAVLSLGARHGDTLTITTEGPEAETTLTTMATLLATDLDEPAPEPTPEPAREPTP